MFVSWWSAVFTYMIVLLSWMGCFGHFSSKPSKCWGTGQLGIKHRHHNLILNQHLLLWPLLHLRAHIPDLYRRLTAAKKKFLHLCSEGVVNKGVNRSGKRVVCQSQLMKEQMLILMKLKCTTFTSPRLRSGGPKLKASQVYPVAFGYRVCKTHLKKRDPGLQRLSFTKPLHRLVTS